MLGADLPYTTAVGARSVVANSRQAERYRSGRAFLAGDAAHVFSAGGSALNVGLTDAIMLAEALSAALRTGGTALDSYQERRYAAGRRALAHTRIQMTLEAADDEGETLRQVFAELLRDRTSARRLAALIEG